MKTNPAMLDETSLTEFEIGPDGRIYVFGASPGVLEILDSLGLGGNEIQHRLAHVQSPGSNHATAAQCDSERHP
jgi:hypothetical protein